jgi:hypothetical protein
MHVAVLDWPQVQTGRPVTRRSARPPRTATAVDIAEGFFFTANSIEDLAAGIRMRYQRVPMPPARLRDTITRYNSFVDSGTDSDFGRPRPRYKIATPPFYAAWATPVIHDTRAGLRINGNCQVMDMDGRIIEGLYCGGESAGGF